ncbi:hypothetical protein C5H21_06515 [Xylella fastidiosa]|nr:hypothetical protein C5H21_06515 [Xylella fastidiosa]
MPCSFLYPLTQGAVMKKILTAALLGYAIDSFLKLIIVIYAKAFGIVALIACQALLLTSICTFVLRCLKVSSAF